MDRNRRRCQLGMADTRTSPIGPSWRSLGGGLPGLPDPERVQYAYQRRDLPKRSPHSFAVPLKKAQSVGWTLDAPTLETIEALIREANKQHAELDTYGNIAHMARRFKDDIGNLYPAWLYDTQTSHATLQSASAYYSPIPDGQPRGPGFRLRRAPETVDNTAAKAAIAFQVGLTGYSKAAGLEDYFQPKLDGFGQRFGNLSV